MAMTNAERQRRYRERHLRELDGQCERIQLLVSLHAKRTLERLASFHGITQREALERALLETQARVLDGLTGAEQNGYMDKALTAEALQGNKDEESLQHNGSDGPLQRNRQDDAALPGNGGEDAQLQRNKGKTKPLQGNEPLSDRDRRILELDGLSEKKAAEVLKAEGIKCSARTVGHVRKRYRERMDTDWPGRTGDGAG